MHAARQCVVEATATGSRRCQKAGAAAKTCFAGCQQRWGETRKHFVEEIAAQALLADVLAVTVERKEWVLGCTTCAYNVAMILRHFVNEAQRILQHILKRTVRASSLSSHPDRALRKLECVYF